ncbi:MAG: PrgI family protein [bacterium]|nr:PrgI family protein [bacterium]
MSELGGVLRFKVPQNIDMEDRILGPLTMVQFVYAVIGFGICYIAANAIPSPFSYVIIAPVALFVICLDFVKINEQPFTHFIKSAIVYMTTPRQRFWHEGEDSDLSIEIYHAEKQQNIVQSKNISQQEISDFAKKTDNTKLES